MTDPTQLRDRYESPLDGKPLFPWSEIRSDIISMMHDGARHTRALWQARHNWVGLTEAEKCDTLAHLVDKARSQIASPAKGRDRITADRILEIIADLHHALEHEREPRE